MKWEKWVKVVKTYKLTYEVNKSWEYNVQHGKEKENSRHWTLRACD